MRADYYTSDCDVYCEDCAPEGADPAFFAEVDCPMHCAECETLLETGLTDDGAEYVADAVCHAVAGVGRPEIVKQWLEHWGGDARIVRELEQSAVDLALAALTLRAEVRA